MRDIAAAAGVGERTFFRYFPSKEDLVLQQVRDLIPGLMRALRERPAAEPPLVALRETLSIGSSRPAPHRPSWSAARRRRTHGEHHEAHALKNDLEDAITEAFLDRLAAAGADRDGASDGAARGRAGRRRGLRRSAA